MNPVTKSYTTAAAQEPISLAFLPVSKITAAVSPAGAGTLTTALLQVTLDQVFDPTMPDYVAPASARWFPVTGFTPPTDAASSSYVTFDGPWQAIRLNTTGGITGTVVFQVAQATTPRA